MASLLEETIKEKLEFETEGCSTGKIENEGQYKGLIELKKCLIDKIFEAIPQEIFEALKIEDKNALSGSQKEAIALFSIQFEGEKIEIKKVKFSHSLMVAFGVLELDEDVFSKVIYKNFISYTPANFSLVSILNY